METLGLLSHLHYRHPAPFEDFVRFESMSNLFYDEDLENKIEIKFDENVLKVEFSKGRFVGIYNGESVFDYDYNAERTWSALYLMPFKFYKFKVRGDFPRKESEFLYPPSGDNLLLILRTHKEMKSIYLTNMDLELFLNRKKTR